MSDEAPNLLDALLAADPESVSEAIGEIAIRLGWARSRVGLRLDVAGGLGRITIVDRRSGIAWRGSSVADASEKAASTTLHRLPDEKAVKS